MKTAQSFDRIFHAFLGRATLGLSPAALGLAYHDWLTHLAVSPAKQLELVQKAIRKSMRLGLYGASCYVKPDMPACIEPLPQDKRFASPEWQTWPFNINYQTFLLIQQWWHNATTDINGVSRHHEEAVSFAARQLLDMFSPSNFPLTNPEVFNATLREGGMNLARGWYNMFEDAERILGNKRPVGSEQFRVGENIAITSGQVIYRNRLIELIQYAPATDKTWKEPVLIIPAWIMKYYILDLSPHNSLVKYLVEQGHTVFMISWKNPGPEDRDLSLEDYRELGLMSALDAVSAIVPDTKVHAVGYCLGGTLLCIAAAAMARDGDDRLQSLSLLAAQIDFKEAGELMLFIDESQVTFLEDMMWEQGYLDTGQMAGAFHLLRSNDLIWSAMIHDYLLGKRRGMNDLMAWNADATRMPYRMHSEYLRKLFLNNDLAEHRYEIGDKPISVNDIRAPIFSVSTQHDHVAPWRSVFKIHLLADNSEVTFLLTSGGHNAGIVSEPGHKGRRYQVATRARDTRYVDPDTWLTRTETIDGSWWPEWQQWLVQKSSEQVSPPGMGNRRQGYTPLEPAPGEYVLGE